LIIENLIVVRKWYLLKVFGIPNSKSQIVEWFFKELGEVIFGMANYKLLIRKVNNENKS